VSPADVEAVVLRVLGRIVPEADLDALDRHEEFRDQLDMDSMDFLNFAIGLDRELGVDVPEADYGQLRSIDACVRYLAPKAAARTRAP
jgi:acyl carrier protein